MKTMKGPAIFLAQFAGDAAPFNTLNGMAGWAASLGYKGVQIPSWDGRLFDLKKASESQTYADELKGFAAGGISEFHAALSRSDEPKTYVQNLLAREKDKVWSLIEKGAVIFVCGDGSKMEPDVKAALIAIYRESTGADAAAGARWIEELGANNRYVLDVWAGG